MTWIEDKRVVVTGATSGIGRAVATQLVAHGAHVVLAARDVAGAERVAAELNVAGTGGPTSVMQLDTADARSIRAFAREYVGTHGALDVLVNNAGVLSPDRGTSADGVELTFATNVVGYFHVTLELLDALRAARSSRVVNVASTFAGHVDLDDVQFNRRPYDGLAAYAQSKACDRMLTWAFARRLAGEAVTVNAMAPGLVLDTKLYRHLPADVTQQLASYGTRTLDDGADTAIWLAAHDDVDGVTGRFFERRTEIACEFRGEAVEDRLWTICEQLVDRRREPCADGTGPTR